MINRLYETESEPDAVKEVISKYPYRITTYLERIIKESRSEALKKQFYPSCREIENTDGLDDPIGDNKHSPVRCLVHRCPDRVLLMVTRECFAYCRFCFRKAIIGTDHETLNDNDLDRVVNYLQENKNIWEVILTGGDPLFIDNSRLKKIFQALSRVPTIEVIRIHTRAPVVNPGRIDKELLEIFHDTEKTLFMVIHANHPDEFTHEMKAALNTITREGIPVLSQSVLLKGVNDSIEVLSALMKSLVKNRIKPYYLHNCDPARGNSHFRVDIKRGQELMKQLRHNYSGLCQPAYMLDIPGGFGKISLEPASVENNEVEWVVYDSKGTKHPFPKI